MLNFNINFEHPWLLLLALPAVLFTLVPYFRSDKRYRRTRNRIISMALHIIITFLSVILLSGMTFAYDEVNEENEIVVLVDVSDSGEKSLIKKEETLADILNIADGNYSVGIVKFAYGQVLASDMTRDMDAALEGYRSSDDPDTSATDIASALKYAKALFEHPESGKIVLITDGLETDNAAMAVIKSIAAEGIRVDTVCVDNSESPEIQIVGVTIPEQQIAEGGSVYMDVHVRHNLAEADKKVTLRLFDNDEQLGEDATVIVSKHAQSLPVTVTLEERGMHSLRFDIEYETDTEKRNNSYFTYINLEIFDNVLLIERNEGEGAPLKALISDSFKVTDISIESDLAEMPETIDDLAEYEQVILVNVAYSDMPAGFEEMLHEYVHDLGGGLFTVGGENDVVGGSIVPHAYNRNDIESSTYYKQMLPVNVIDYTPPIAVMIVIDTSASMADEGRLSAAVKGAEACLDALNDRDYCGVMSFESQASEKLRVLPVSQKEKIINAIRDVEHETATGGTIYADAIMRAGTALSLVDEAERKHIIIVSDGMPSDSLEEYVDLIRYNRKSGITMSVVALNAGSQYVSQLQNTAKEGGGEFYNIPKNDLDRLPKIMTNDLAMNAVGEIEYGEEFSLRFKDKSPITDGIRIETVPPLTGYYGTLLKEDAIAPIMGRYVPIYAEWSYGEGRVGSFLSDLNGTWSEKFIKSNVGKEMIVNTVAHLFPYEDVKPATLDYTIKSDNYTTQVNVQSRTDGNRVIVAVEPVSKELAALYENGITVRSAEDSRRFTFETKYPGLYRIIMTELDSEGAEISDTYAYVTFSYSEEYDLFVERAPIGEELAALIAKDGNGSVIEDPADVFLTFTEAITKRTDPRAWLLVITILLVLTDIAVRKFKFKWIWELIGEYKKKKAEGRSRSV